MALRKINKFLEAISIGPKKGEQKKFEGYLTGGRYGIGKTKKKKGNTLYAFQDATGAKCEVWGNASINGALCDADKIDSALVGKWIVIEFLKTLPAKKGFNAQKLCDISVDDEKTLHRKNPGAKTYQLDKNK